MRLLRIYLLPTVVILGATSAVSAQWDDSPSPQRSPFSNLRFSISVGGFAPIGNLATTSDTTLGGAVSVGLHWGRPTTARPFTGGLFYEAAGVSRSVPSPYPVFYSGGASEAFTIEGGGPEGMVYLSPGKAARLYIGGGVGIFQVKRKTVSSDNGFTAVFSNDVIESTYRINAGYRGVVGLEIGRGFFAEGRYLNAGAMEGVRFQGFSLSAGYRY